MNRRVLVAIIVIIFMYTVIILASYFVAKANKHFEYIHPITIKEKNEN